MKMSNDLINRQETYKELIGRIDYIRDKDYELYCEIGDVIQDCIENISTAYSVDKVVEELEEIEQHCLDMSDWQGQSAICDAIEIVKQGGVSDDVCEWEKSKDYPFDWLVGCDGCEVNHRQGDYCPRCGKKIKAVE